jgi:hypothetical protein
VTAFQSVILLARQTVGYRRAVIIMDTTVDIAAEEVRIVLDTETEPTPILQRCLLSLFKTILLLF